MNKQDYIEQGRQAFINGLSLSTGCAKTESWQSKAIVEGWNAAHREACQKQPLKSYQRAIVEEFQTVAGDVVGVVSGLREIESLEYVGSGEFSIGGIVKHSENIPRSPVVASGVTPQDVAQRPRTLSVLGHDVEWCYSQIIERMTREARIIANATVPQCDGDYARRSHILDLLAWSASYGASERAARLARKALEVAWRLVVSHA